MVASKCRRYKYEELISIHNNIANSRQQNRAEKTEPIKQPTGQR